MTDTNTAPYDDEISISELIMKLWARRGLIVTLPLVMAGLTVALLLATKVAAPNGLFYYIELVGIESRLGDAEGSAGSGSETRYPNDILFSPQDLLNPEVTARLAVQFGIENGKRVARGISVRYGTPLTEGLLREYRAALSASSKASAEDVALIATRYDERIRASARRGLRIDVDYAELGIDASTGELVAQELPQVWNEVYANRFRIFIDTGVLGLSVAEVGATSIATTVGALEADLQLRNINDGVKLLRDDARFRALRSESGASPAELAQRISDFRSIYFEPIYSSSFASVYSLARVYRLDLELSLKELDIALEELNSRISTITELQQRGSTTSGNVSAINGDSSQVQIGGDSLGQIVNLSRQASLSAYLTTSFDARLDMVTTKAELSTRYEKMIANSSVSSANMLSVNFVRSAEAQFETIQKEHVSLLSIAQAMALNETPTLYQAMSAVTGTESLN